jgi:hypothetical protein
VPNDRPAIKLARMEIDLDREERQILRTILEHALSDLRMEMADTDRKEFRDMLGRRKAVLEKVLESMSGPPTAG